MVQRVSSKVDNYSAGQFFLPLWYISCISHPALFNHRKTSDEQYGIYHNLVQDNSLSTLRVFGT